MQKTRRWYCCVGFSGLLMGLHQQRTFVLLNRLLFENALLRPSSQRLIPNVDRRKITTKPAAELKQLRLAWFRKEDVMLPFETTQSDKLKTSEEIFSSAAFAACSTVPRMVRRVLDGPLPMELHHRLRV